MNARSHIYRKQWAFPFARARKNVGCCVALYGDMEEKIKLFPVSPHTKHGGRGEPETWLRDKNNNLFLYRAEGLGSKQGTKLVLRWMLVVYRQLIVIYMMCHWLLRIDEPNTKHDLLRRRQRCRILWSLIGKVNLAFTKSYLHRVGSSMMWQVNPFMRRAINPSHSAGCLLSSSL